MSELEIRTVRHSIRVAVPPRQVYQLIANVDRWPMLFDSITAVEHIGYDGINELVRFWGMLGNHRGSWVSSREVNLKRMQVRFRHENPAPPFASLGGLWFVVPKGSGSLVALDHFYRVVDDNPVDARRLEDTVDRSGTTMLASLRELAEADDDSWLSPPSPVAAGMQGVSPS